jgi:hypothetical protein
VLITLFEQQFSVVAVFLPHGHHPTDRQQHKQLQFLKHKRQRFTTTKSYEMMQALFQAGWGAFVWANEQVATVPALYKVHKKNLHELLRIRNSVSSFMSGCCAAYVAFWVIFCLSVPAQQQDIDGSFFLSMSRPHGPKTKEHVMTLRNLQIY